MADTKIRLSFFTYKDGVEVNHTSGATFVNDLSESEQKAKEFLVKHFPQATNFQKKKDDNFLEQGGWIIRGDSKDDPSMAFVLVISRLS